MEHREYLRRAEDDRFALLMIHGIVGSPVHFRDLMPAIPPHWSVYNILLTALRVTRPNLSPEDTAAWAMKTDTGTALPLCLWKYIPWLPRMLLAAEQRPTEEIS